MASNKVYFNGRFLRQRETGVQRYAREILRELDALIESGAPGLASSFCLLAPEQTELPRLRAIETRTVGPFSGHLWEQVTLPWAARDGLLWGFGPTGPLIHKRQAVTMHDANVRVVPQAYSWKFRAYYELTMPLLARRSQVMTVSEFSRAEIARHFGAEFDSMRVSGEGWEHASRVESDCSILAEHGLKPGRYVLAVSSVTPHKNFAVIERAIACLAADNYRVAIAGEVNPRVFGSLPAKSLDSISMVGYVTNGALRALYENAGVFVYPSLYEGFGLPPLEAMACGCPVIASNAASIPEVCGDAALYFNPHNDHELAKLIQRVMSDEHARATMVAKGRAQLSKHSWEAAARAHFDAIESTLGAGACEAPGGRPPCGRRGSVPGAALWPAAE